MRVPNTLAYFLSFSKWPLPSPPSPPHTTADPNSSPVPSAASPNHSGPTSPMELMQSRSETRRHIVPSHLSLWPLWSCGSVPCTQPLLDSHRKTHLPVCWVQQMCVHLRPFEYALPSAAKVLPKPASGSFPPSLCWPQLAGQLSRSHWVVSLRCFTLSTDLITRITGYHKSSHFSDMPHTPPYSQILLSPSMLYKQRGREWVITTNKWQCGAGPQAVTLQADGAVQCTACTAVHCGRRARAIIDLPVCSVRFVVNFEWPHLKQMKE